MTSTFCNGTFLILPLHDCSHARVSVTTYIGGNLHQMSLDRCR